MNSRATALFFSKAFSPSASVSWHSASFFEGAPLKVSRTLTCKPRPGSGLDCLMCATFAWQRGSGVLSLSPLSSALPSELLLLRFFPRKNAKIWLKRRHPHCLLSRVTGDEYSDRKRSRRRGGGVRSQSIAIETNGAPFVSRLPRHSLFYCRLAWASHLGL